MTDVEHRLRVLELEVSKHLGQCEERHKDIVRRHEEGRADRGQLRVDLAQVTTAQSKEIEKQSKQIDKLNTKMWAIAIGVASGAIAIIVQFAFIFFKTGGFRG